MSSVRIGRDDFPATIHDAGDHESLEHIFVTSDRHTSKMPTVPDLRYEHSYLKSIRPHVHVEHLSSIADGQDKSSELPEQKYLRGRWTYEKTGPMRVLLEKWQLRK